MILVFRHKGSPTQDRKSTDRDFFGATIIREDGSETAITADMVDSAINNHGEDYLWPNTHRLIKSSLTAS